MSPKPMVDPNTPKPGLDHRTLLAAIAFSLLIVAVILGGVIAGRAYGKPTDAHPIPAPDSLTRARAACPATTTIVECRGRLREAYQALAWTQKARRDDARRANGYGVDHAIHLAAALYGVPVSELQRVGTCESHLTPSSKNTSSTASGLFQFLDSTWARAGVPGFSVFDPYANAIAAARLVRSDGSWREWSCQP